MCVLFLAVLDPIFLPQLDYYFLNPSQVLSICRLTDSCSHNDEMELFKLELNIFLYWYFLIYASYWSTHCSVSIDPHVRDIGSYFFIVLPGNLSFLARWQAFGKLSRIFRNNAFPFGGSLLRIHSSVVDLGFFPVCLANAPLLFSSSWTACAFPNRMTIASWLLLQPAASFIPLLPSILCLLYYLTRKGRIVVIWLWAPCRRHNFDRNVPLSQVCQRSEIFFLWIEWLGDFSFSSHEDIKRMGQWDDLLANPAFEL